MRKIPAREEGQSVLFCGVCGKRMRVYSTRRERIGGQFLQIKYWKCTKGCENSENGKTIERIAMTGVTKAHFNIIDGDY